MVLGDSLVVMNSLLEYEGLGGQVQMIYIDPPYGVKFGSNFQPFVRKRDVKHNDDADMTREPEMVQAYRDTWELGLHSYLTYLRDRLLVARELLTESGSVFVQISDENLHHVREVMDEIFGVHNFVSVVNFRKKSMPLGAKYLEEMNNYLLWYGRDATKTKYRELYKEQDVEGLYYWNWVELPDRSKRRLSREEMENHALLLEGSHVASLVSLKPPTFSAGAVFPISLDEKEYWPDRGSCWISNQVVMQRLADGGRLVPSGKSLRYFYKLSDFPLTKITNQWPDMGSGNFTDQKIYAVQTSAKVVQRCVLMTTDPGDLVLDPTCGSGTAAYVAEQWGRRWITIDTSRVPLALARQRILTATYPWYELADDKRGPAGGFVYRRKQNNKGEEVGGIVPHITLKSIANDEPPKQEVLVDRPDQVKGITRVSGPFVVEATMPTPMALDGDSTDDSAVATAAELGSFIERMLDVLRRSPILQIGAGRSITLRNLRPPARSLALSAEALVDASADGQRPSLADVIDEADERRGDRLQLSSKLVAIAFGPENGSVSEKLVFEAAREARARSYTHLYVIGFGIQPNAREMIENSEQMFDLPATYVQMTPDIMMGDLLKNLRSSQIFSVCGLPDIEAEKVKKKDKTDPERYVVRLLGLDTFNPIDNTVDSLEGDDVPCWLLDAEYNDLCFHVSQAFFPRTGAWENLRKALRADYEESVWEHLNGAESAPFEATKETKIAVKVIDHRGNELMVVKTIGEVLKK
jgi:adenine-specific DNA-methyltransferase